ncbi:hypothetical protein P3T21_000518 [Paraburkholderia sp. GAS334]
MKAGQSSSRSTGSVRVAIVTASSTNVTGKALKAHVRTNVLLSRAPPPSQRNS